MNSSILLDTRYRTKFKQMISSHRSQTSQTSHSQNQNHITLSELSSRTRVKEENRKLHTLSKQTFITNRKQFLLSRKLFFKKNNKNDQNFDMSSIKKENNVSVYDDLMSPKCIEQEEIFNISHEIMKNPFSFHRNMITKIKDDKGTKNILKKWYSNNVSGNIEKLKKVEAYEKQKVEYNKRSHSYVQFNEKLKRQNKMKSSFLKTSSFRQQVLRVNNENEIKKYSSSSNYSLKKQNTDKLAKLIVRLQPFWYKVRLKI